MVFVLSLLHTVRSVERLLRDAHARSPHAERPFALPPVIVLIENNFAYGAATYMQMLWLIRHHHRAVYDIARDTMGGGVPAASSPPRCTVSTVC